MDMKYFGVSGMQGEDLIDPKKCGTAKSLRAAGSPATGLTAATTDNGRRCRTRFVVPHGNYVEMIRRHLKKIEAVGFRV